VLPVILRSERLVLDAPTMGDRDAVAEYCTDPVFERFMTLPWPYEQKDADYFLSTHVPAGWANENEFTWAIRTRTDGPLIGAIGHRVELQDVGFWLGAPHRGNGYMTEAVVAVCDWLFERGSESVRWECVVGNAASASVARKAGFTFTGTAPANVRSRDGAHEKSWHGVLLSTDSRAVQPGWPD